MPENAASSDASCAPPPCIRMPPRAFAFFFTGVHPDYHGVNDEVDGIDFTKMRRIAQTIYATARVVADGAQRPKVDGGRP